MKDITKPLLILGTRTFAEEIADVVSEIPGIKIAGFVENMDRERCKNKINGLPVFWVEELAELAKTHQAICGLGTTRRCIYTSQVEKYGIPFMTLAHPSSRISANSYLGEGTFVSVGCIISTHVRLGDHVVVNRGGMIGHHTHISSFVTIGPNANVAGNSYVGEGVYIGMSATIIDHISVGKHSIIAAGAVVIKNVPDRVMVAGVPAKIIRENVEPL